eukprot:5459835-Alexandrium_andersonii.AAC.1
MPLVVSRLATAATNCAFFLTALSKTLAPCSWKRSWRSTGRAWPARAKSRLWVMVPGTAPVSSGTKQQMW